MMGDLRGECCRASITANVENAVVVKWFVADLSLRELYNVKCDMFRISYMLSVLLL